MTKNIVIIGCLLILATQTIFQGIMAKTDSQTTDEAVHVTAGYTYLTQGDFRFNPEHPPLVKTLSAVPLLFMKPNLPADFDEKWQESESFFYDSWKENRYLGEQFFWNSGNDADQMVFWSRIPIVLLTLLLGLSIFLISIKLFGPIPALAATGFYALSPLVTAHGHLVTTDITVTLGILLSTYTSWKLLSKPTWQNGVWFGLAFGFALMAKHTAIIFIPILAVLVVFTLLKKKNRELTKNTFKSLLVSLGIIFVVIWISFGFQNRSIPKTSNATTEIILAQGELEDSQVAPNKTGDKLYSIARPILSVLPGDYVKGVSMLLIHTSGGHDTFLLGENSKTGWWYYFPLLLLLKLPIITLISLAGFLYLYFANKPKNTFISTILITSSLFMLAAMSSKANLGLRHILPILPLLFIGIGWVTTMHDYAKKGILVGLVILSITFASSYPNYLGYFNEFAGAKEKNYTVATDSNLDWGQDLKRIRNYIEENKLEKPFIEYGWLGTDALNYYIKDNYQLLIDETPKIGDELIIGATAVSSGKFDDVLKRCDEFGQITNGTLTCKIIR